MSERAHKQDLLSSSLSQQQQLTQPVRLLNLRTGDEQGNLTTKLPTKPPASAAQARPAREAAREAARELVNPASQSNQCQSQSQSQSQRQPQSRSRSQSPSWCVGVSQSPLRARKREPNSASHQPLPSALATPHPPSLLPTLPSSLRLQALPRCIFTCMFGPLETRCELRLKVPTKTLNRPSWPAGKGGRRRALWREGGGGKLSGSAERGSKEENATEPYKKLKKNKRKRTKFNFVCKQASAVRCECVCRMCVCAVCVYNVCGVCVCGVCV